MKSKKDVEEKKLSISNARFVVWKCSCQVKTIHFKQPWKICLQQKQWFRHTKSAKNDEMKISVAPTKKIRREKNTFSRSYFYAERNFKRFKTKRQMENEEVEEKKNRNMKRTSKDQMVWNEDASITIFAYGGISFYHTTFARFIIRFIGLVFSRIVDPIQ